jgi:glycosyltransferase involved in cell wall biosynthesis
LKCGDGELTNKVAFVSLNFNNLHGSRNYQANFVHYLTTIKNKDIALRDSIEFKNVKYRKIDYGLMYMRIIFNMIHLHKLNKFLPTSKIEKELKKHDVDLVYFLAPNLLVYDLNDIDFISTVFDINSIVKSDYGYLDYNFINKILNKNLFTYLKNYSKLVVVDSFLNATILKNKFNFRRVIVSGLFPKVVENKKFTPKKNLLNLSKRKYIIYIAAFWEHKNHIFLLDVLKLLKNHQINLIFVGEDKGYLTNVKKKAQKMGIEKKVINIKNITEDERNYLLKSSVAVVYPSKYGPTNLPPIESIILGKETLCSPVSSELLNLYSVSKLIRFIPLDSPEVWAKIIDQIYENPPKFIEEDLSQQVDLENFKFIEVIIKEISNILSIK